MDNLASVVAALNNGVVATNALAKTIDEKFPDFFTSVPTSATATGTAGQMAANTSFLYVCVSDNVWRRVAISSF